MNVPLWDAMIACGQWSLIKWRHQAKTVGVYQAARNLRKQGVPLRITLLLLRAK